MRRLREHGHHPLPQRERHAKPSLLPPRHPVHPWQSSLLECHPVKARLSLGRQMSEPGSHSDNNQSCPTCTTRTGDGVTEQLKGTLSSQTRKSHFCTIFQCSTRGRHFGGRNEVLGQYQCDQQCGTGLSGAFPCSTPCSPQGPRSKLASCLSPITDSS